MDFGTRDSSSPAARPASRASGERARPDRGHAAAVVASDAELLTVALPYLEDGLSVGDLVVLSCPPETTELISRGLGEHAVTLESDPRLSLLGARAPDAIATCQRYLDRAAAGDSGRLRILADTDFGCECAGWREGQRFEAVFNRLTVGLPLLCLCTYDRRRQAETVVESSAATHPLLVQGGAWVPSPGYRDPAEFVPTLPVPREPFEDGPPVLAIDAAPTLAGLRHRLAAVIDGLVPDGDQREDLRLGVSEIAANAFRHGTLPVSARMWVEGDRVVCVIRDSGNSFADLLSGFVPARGADLSRGGMGLWLARKLWDHVDLLPGPDGFSVRLSTRLR